MAVWILSRKEHSIPEDINKPEIPGTAFQRPCALYNMQNSATARLLFYRLKTQTLQPRENIWTKALHLIQSDHIQSRKFQTVFEQLSRLLPSQRKYRVHFLLMHELEKGLQSFWWMKVNSHIFSLKEKEKKKNKQRENKKMSFRRIACTKTHQKCKYQCWKFWVSSLYQI